MEKVNLFDLIEVNKAISNPFSREIHISEIKEEYGNGFFIFYDMGNGIAVFIRNFVPSTDFIFIENSEIAGTSLVFNLSTDINFIYKDKKECVLKKDNFIVGLSSNEFYVEIPLLKGKPLITFTIGMKEELFTHISDKISSIEDYKNKAKKDSYYILHNKNIDLQQFEMLDFFKNLDTYENTLSRIHLESKTTDLLHYTVKKVVNILSDANNICFDKGRIANLEKAKEIIMEEYNSKLSIKTIAYKSAINECYLKKDFKAYYGMTILEMLQKRRLDVAKKLLKENLGVKEVAFKIGYKNSSHFSKLFFQHFSITPNNYRKHFIDL